MKIHYDIQQGSEDWFLLRLGKYTCSDGQAISANGKGLETLAFTKVAERLTKKAMESYDNEAMQRGRELEELARNSYELEKGITTKQIGFVELDEWIGGSPDGFIGDDGLIEIKCPTDRVFVEYMFYKKIDTKYLAQMQMQMFITGRKYCDYVLFNPNFEKSLIITRVLPDKEMVEKIQMGLTKGVEFAKQIMSKI